MGWRERSAWICLVSTCVIFGVYFWFVARTFAHGQAVAQPVLVAFLVACVAFAIVVGSVHALSALLFGMQRADERDAAINASALRVAYYFLIACIFTAFPVVALLGALQPAAPDGRIWVPGFSITSQVVLFCCVAAEALRFAVQVVAYRRDARR
jgi:hypothetical protein